MAHAADGRGDGHIIVVQDHDQALTGLSCLIHGLISHASGYRAVTDNGDHNIIIALQIPARTEAQCRRDLGCRMGRAKRVIVTLGPFGEARQATALA